MEEGEFRKEAVAPFHRFLMVPDGLDPGEFTYFVSVILVFILHSLLPDLNHGSYFQIRLVASIRYIVDAAVGCTQPPVSQE